MYFPGSSLLRTEGFEIVTIEILFVLLDRSKARDGKTSCLDSQSQRGPHLTVASVADAVALINKADFGNSGRSLLFFDDVKSQKKNKSLNTLKEK